MPDIFDTVADPPATVAGDVFDKLDQQKPSGDIFDQLSQKQIITKLSADLVNQPSQFGSGLPPGTPLSDNPDWSLTGAVVNDPGKLSKIPGAVMQLAGNVVRGAGADVVSAVASSPLEDGHASDKEYGGNLAAISDPLHEGPLPVDKFLGSVAQTNPNLATLGKVAQGLAATAPLAAVGALPAWAGKLVAAGFSAQMIADAPELSRQLGTELGKPPEQRDPDKLTSLISDAIQTGVFAPLAGAHAGTSATDFLESKVSPTTYLAKQLATQLKSAPLDMPVKAGQVQSAEDFLRAPKEVVQTSELKPSSPAPEPVPPTPVATSPQAESATPVNPVETPVPAEPIVAPTPETPLMPVDVTDGQIKAMRAPAERPPDILDTIGDHFPNGVQFASKADFGDYINQAQGAAKELMSHTQGEPADVVLDGLHLAGEAHGIENIDELAQAMVSAGKTRIGQRDDVNAAAKALAEEQARTQMFEKANRPTRPGVESVPAQQLFVGDEFKMNGQPMRVTGFAIDDTGKPFGVEVDGAFGKQTLDADSQVHIDRGSLQEAPPGRVAASGTSAPRVTFKPGDKVVHDGEVKTVTRAIPGVDFIGVGKRAANIKDVRLANPEEIKTGRVAASGTSEPRTVNPRRLAGATPTRAARTPVQVPAAIAKTPVPPTGPIRTALNNASTHFKTVLAPHTLDAGAATVANILRDVNGERANQLARADEAMSSWRKEFDRTPVPANYVYDPAQPLPHNYAVIKAFENDRGSLPPRYHQLAQYFDQAFQDRIKTIQQFAPNALQTLIKDYFPHVWQDPKRAANVMANVATKLFAGRKEFLKQRSLPMFTDGLERGLKPISDNPVDILLAKMASMDKFIAALKAQAEFKEIGAMKFHYALEKMPDGWTRVEDPAFVVNTPPVVTLKEAYDATLRTKTFELLQKLGVKNSRLATLGGKRWGLAYESPEQIKTRFAGPMSVYFHELGHILDFRYDLQKNFLKQGKSFDQQLRYLADRRLPVKGATKSYRAYVRNGAEKMAVMTEAYVHAPDIFKRVAPEVYAKFDQFIEDHPELHDIRELKPSLRLDTAETEHKLGGVLKLGDWIMPDGPAAVMKNYLSPGLESKPLVGPIYKSVRAMSNYLNQAQLGWSAFHVGFTSGDAAVSTLSNGLVQASRGDFKGGGKSLLKAPFAPVANYYVGKAVARAMLDPNATSIKMLGFEKKFNPVVHDYAKLAVKAGLRATVDPFWQTHMTRNLMRSIREGGKSWGKVPFQAPFALSEQLMRPIAEFLVPRQKLGVFAQIAKTELEKIGPGADIQDIRAAVARAADYTEDRMGQMTYDNLFYNKVAKDLALVGFRAYGWQLGKYRHLSGAVLDTAHQLKAANSRYLLGDKTAPKWELTHRQAYFIALTLGVATIGAILHRMFTGHAPQSMMDYFHPSTGQIDANGNPKRLSLPTYMKDLESDATAVYQGGKAGGPLGVVKGVAQSTYHRMNPWLSEVGDMLNNRDFYGTQIYNPEDPLMSKMLDQAKFIAKGFAPFSITGAQKMMEGQHSARDVALPFFGVVPASKLLTMTPAEAFFAQSFRDTMPAGAKTQAQNEQFQLRSKLVSDLKAAQAGTKIPDLPARLVAAGYNDKAAVTRLIQKAEWLPIQYQAHYLPLTTAMRGYDLANSQEKQALAPILMDRIQSGWERNKLSAEDTSNYVKQLMPAYKSAK